MNIKKNFRTLILVLFLISAPGFLMYAFLPAETSEAKNTDNSNELFFENPFGYPISLKNFRQNISRLKINSQAVSNHYNEKQVDTIYALSFRQSEIKLYKAKEKSLLINADIQNRRIKLYQNIHVGMKKEELEQKLGSIPQIKNNSITLEDNEGRTTYLFYFNRRKRLSQIKILTDIE